MEWSEQTNNKSDYVMHAKIYIFGSNELYGNTRQ